MNIEYTEDEEIYIHTRITKYKKKVQTQSDLLTVSKIANFQNRIRFCEDYNN